MHGEHLNTVIAHADAHVRRSAVLYQPSTHDLARWWKRATARTEVSPTAAARAASFDNPFAMNTEPPSY